MHEDDRTLTQLTSKIDHLTWECNAHKAQIAAHEKTLNGLQKSIADDKLADLKKDQRALIYGIITLGSFVATLVGVIWAYRGAIFK